MTKHSKQTIFIALLLLVSWVIVCVPLLTRGFIPTHDGEYSIIRFMEFFRMLSQGNLFPKWAPTVNSGYGLPVFIFYYPLTNYIGSAFHLFGWNFIESFKLALAFGYGLALVCSYLWLSKLFGKWIGCVGAICGALVPYWFVELYVRGTLPEVWAIAFIFVILASIERKNGLGIACGFCGLILSHNILGLLFTPVLAGYQILRDTKKLMYPILGIGMASYFWIPALWEQKYVVGLNTVLWKDHFAQLYELIIPSWGTAFSSTGALGTKMSFQLGVGAIFAMIAACIYGIRETVRPTKKILFYWLGIMAGALILSLPLSAILWKIIPLLSYTQYPWRFICFVIPVTAFCVSYSVSKFSKRWLGIGVVILFFVLSFPYMRPVVYEPRDDRYYLSRTNFTDGTISMGNSFSTIWSPWKDTRSSIVEISNGRMTGSANYFSYMRKRFDMTADMMCHVTMALTYYPGWKVSIDGKPAAIAYRKQGIVEFDVPPGKHRVEVAFTDSADRIVANLLSLGSLGFLLAFIFRKKEHI